MTVPGMRRIALCGGKLHVWSDERRVVLQVRASGPQDDPLATWAKAAVQLEIADALAVAGELLAAASRIERAKP
jgi:hypothetical protein